VNSVRAEQLYTVVQQCKEDRRSKDQKCEGPEQSVDKGGCAYGPAELLTFEGSVPFNWGNRARRDTDPKNIVGEKSVTRIVSGNFSEGKGEKLSM
jgi:hypothetical protein